MKLSSLLFDTGKNYELSDVFEMAEYADNFGFERFWLGEHYDYQNLWSSPEPLIPVILGITERITVGAAGMLLKLNAPLRVASAFKLMNVIYPNRVDLGMAGGDTFNEKVKRFMLNGCDTSQVSDYYKLVEETVSFLSEEPKHNKDNVYVNPSYFPKPNLWLLSTSFNRVDKALDWGLNYSKSLFHSGINNTALIKEELDIFKEKFFAKHGRKPAINIAFSGVLTRNDKQTSLVKKEIKNSTKLKFIVPNIIGTPDVFLDKINEYKAYYQVDDFTFLDLSDQMSDRIENIQILSELFKLKAVSH